MLRRTLGPRVSEKLRNFPVVALLGPRQVGKTTLARMVADEISKAAVYLDLERPGDRAKLSEAELYLARQERKLTILDEVQRMPELFPLLRSVVDDRIRKGEKAGQFLILGSACRDLLRQSSESLAGRIAYLELAPFDITETSQPRRKPDIDRLWVRGGFPPSFLARSDADSLGWREQFVRTYLERDLPNLGLRVSSELQHRFWSMLAHSQGAQLNSARFAASLGVAVNTVRHHLDILTELFMVRQLVPWSGNSQKRLVKSPKVYVRDSGLTHALTNIPDLETLLGHPLCGESWEGFVIETLLCNLPSTWRASYYRTGAQAEIDLVLEGPKRQVYAIEIKRSLAPTLSRGFHNGFADIKATRGFCITPGGESFPLTKDVEAVPLVEFCKTFAELVK